MSTSNSTPTLAVTGYGSVRLPPDRIVFTLELDALAPTVDEAHLKIEDLRHRLSAALVSAGVDSNRVRSSGPQVAPQHDHEKSRWVFKGIRGSERVTVRIPFEKGRATDVMRALGGELDHLRVSIGHLVRDTSAARAEALRAAVADARTQAQIIADASSMELGPVQELKHEPTSSRQNTVFGTLADAGPDLGAEELDPAEILVTARVNAVWTLTAKETGGT